MKTLPSLLLIFLALAGCDNRPNSQAMLEVNDANCTQKVINQIEDRAVSTEVAGRCSKHRGAIQPTKQPMNWLELNSSQR